MLAERLSRLDGREKLGLLIVILIILIALADWAVVRPIHATCENLDADIRRESEELVYQRGMLQAASAVEQQYTVVDARLGAAPPTEAEAIDVMKGNIQRMADDSDVSLLATKGRDKPRKTGVYDEYTLDVSDFETDEQGLTRFLYTLSHEPGAYRLSKLKIAPDSTGKRVKGTMSITKVQVAQPTAPAADSKSAAPQG